MFQSCSVTCQRSIKGIRIRPLASVHLLLSRYCPVAIRLTDGSVHADKLPARRCLFRWIFAFCNLVDTFSHFFPFVVFLSAAFKERPSILVTYRPKGCTIELAATDQGDFFSCLQSRSEAAATTVKNNMSTTIRAEIVSALEIM